MSIYNQPFCTLLDDTGCLSFPEFSFWSSLQNLVSALQSRSHHSPDTFIKDIATFWTPGNISYHTYHFSKFCLLCFWLRKWTDTALGAAFYLAMTGLGFRWFTPRYQILCTSCLFLLPYFGASAQFSLKFLCISGCHLGRLHLLLCMLDWTPVLGSHPRLCRAWLRSLHSNLYSPAILLLCRMAQGSQVSLPETLSVISEHVLLCTLILYWVAHSWVNQRQV